MVLFDFEDDDDLAFSVHGPLGSWAPLPRPVRKATAEGPPSRKRPLHFLSIWGSAFPGGTFRGPHSFLRFTDKKAAQRGAGTQETGSRVQPRSAMGESEVHLPLTLDLHIKICCLLCSSLMSSRCYSLSFNDLFMLALPSLLSFARGRGREDHSSDRACDSFQRSPSARTAPGPRVNMVVKPKASFYKSYFTTPPSLPSNRIHTTQLTYKRNFKNHAVMLL